MTAATKMWKEQQRGMTMMEVLIAILILSVGLFSMLGLLMNSMKLTATSNYRAMATQHAHTMANLISSGGSAIFAYDYKTPGDATVEDKCFSSGCSQTDLVNTQVRIWLDQIATALPKGAGVVCKSKSLAGNPDDWKCDGDGTSPYVVKVCWDETRVGVGKAGAGGAPYYECIYTSQ